MFDCFFVLFDYLGELLISLNKEFIHFFLNFNRVIMVFLNILFFRNNSLLSCEFHLNFHFLHPFNLLNIVFLLHLSLPPIKLRRVFKPHFHLLHQFSLLFLLFINQVFLSFQHRNVQFNIGSTLLEVGHCSRFEITEFECVLNPLVHFVAHLLGTFGTGQLFSREVKPLLLRLFIFFPNQLCSRLSPLLLIHLNIR